MAAPQSLSRPVDLWPGNHVAWAVENRDEVAGAVHAYFGEGVRRGERLIYMPRGEAALGAVLDVMPDGDELADRGQLRVESADDAYAPLVAGDVRGQAERFGLEAGRAVADGYSGIRVWADVTPLVRDDAVRRQFLDYEIAIERTFRSVPATGLCALDVDDAGDEWARLACRHRFRNGRVTSPRVCVDVHDGVLRLLGEVDVACAGELRDALASVGRTTDGQIVVDLEGLEFLDISGTRALATFIADQKSSGSSVELVGARPVERKLLALFGLHEGVS